jgi:type I restriction enzyme R subunit
MLLQTLKEAKLVLDWRKKQRSRADVYTTVKTVLDELPRAYTPELYQQKCETVYQHVYDSYQGRGPEHLRGGVNTNRSRKGHR